MARLSALPMAAPSDSQTRQRTSNLWGYGSCDVTEQKMPGWLTHPLIEYTLNTGGCAQRLTKKTRNCENKFTKCDFHLFSYY